MWVINYTRNSELLQIQQTKSNQIIVSNTVKPLTTIINKNTKQPLTTVKKTAHFSAPKST